MEICGMLTQIFGKDLNVSLITIIIPIFLASAAFVNFLFSSKPLKRKIIISCSVLLLAVIIWRGSIWLYSVLGPQSPVIISTIQPPAITRIPQQAPMVAIDTYSTPSLLKNSGNAKWSHTIGSHSNRLLMVEIVTATTATTVQDVTFGSTSLKMLSAKDCPKNCHVEIWYEINPPIGTAAISVATTATFPVTTAAVSFYNVDQTTPFALETQTETANKGTSSTLSVASNAKQLIVDFYGNQATSDFIPRPGPGQAQYVPPTNTTAQQAAISTKVGAVSSTTLTWNWGSVNNYADIGIAINANQT